MRETALAAEHARHSPRWVTVHGMRIPGRFESEGDPRELALADLSCFARTGLKGPNAVSCLAQLGVPVPARANSWTMLSAGGLVARVGEAEFLVEDGLAPDAAAALARGLADAHGVYPVSRRDMAIALMGSKMNEVLLQTCSVDFAAADVAGGALALTTMVGVPVLAIPQHRDGLSALRLWADPTFGPYLWRTLLEIVRELGGGPAGLARLYPELQNQGESA